MPFDSNRRSFLTRIVGAATVGTVAVRAERPGNANAQQPPASQPAQHWNTGWLDQFKGRHKQVYDLMWHTLRPNTLNPPMFYFDTIKEISQLEHPDVNVVIGVNTSYALNLSDAIWAKYNLGERSDVKDPATGKPALRNVYLGTGKDDRGSSVRKLQSRGAVFIQCNVALSGGISGLARESGRPVADVDAEVRAGLNPGVVIVPALTWAVAMLQERGFTYEKL